MAEPDASSGDNEFPKNSIKLDKFTGFIDKFLKTKLLGKDAAEHGRRGILPWTAILSITANAGICGDEIPPDWQVPRIGIGGNSDDNRGLFDGSTQLKPGETILKQ